MPESPFGTPEESTGNEGLGNLIRSLADTSLGYLHARLLLLRIESKEATSVLTRRIWLVSSASSFLFLAYAFGVVALVSLGAERFEMRWEHLALIVAAAHFVLGLIFFALVRLKLSRPLFEASLKEFKKDREWLQNRKNS